MGVIFPKSSYPNSQSTIQKVSNLKVNWVLTLIKIHQITEELQTTVANFFTPFRWLVDNGKTDKSLDFIVQ